MSEYQIWLPESVGREMKMKASRADEEGVIYSEALESVLREYGIGMAELELARDDAGWMRIGINDSSGIDVLSRTYSVKRARAYYNRDPLSKQAVRIWTNYGIGRGISWKAKDDKAADAIRAFWDDPVNDPILSNQGQHKSSDMMLVDGEIFFVFFVSGKDVKIRHIDPLEITEIITDPDDKETKKLYKREWTTVQNHTFTRYYPDWTNADPSKEWPDSIGGPKAATPESGVIYHIPFNSLGIRGISLLLSGMDWAKAHRKFLEARASITQALARFAWKAKLKGTPAQVAAEKTNLQSTYASGSGEETNPPSSPGGTWIENEGYTMTPIKTESGASAAQVDANMLMQVFGASVGIFPHYFGAGEAFRLATATAMERPMRVQFEAYQQLWSDIYDNIFNFVMEKNNIQDDKRFVDIDFPPIVEKDSNEKIKAIIEVITAMPELDGDEMRKLILTTLGINNPDEVLANKDPVESSSHNLVKALKEYRVALVKEDGNGNGNKGVVSTLP